LTFIINHQLNKLKELNEFNELNDLNKLNILNKQEWGLPWINF